MGIKKLREKTEKAPVKPYITLEMDVSTPETPDAKECLRFREPHTTDLPKVQEKAKHLSGMFPGADEGFLFKVAFIAFGYVPDEAEGETQATADEAFVGLAIDNEFIFDDLLEEYAKEYPLFFVWLAKRAGIFPSPSET